MSTRAERKREFNVNGLAPAPAESVIARSEARIAWLETELAKVPGWLEELAVLKRMLAAAKGEGTAP